MYETEWQTCYWISECMNSEFRAHALCSTFYNTKYMFPFPKHLEHSKGYEARTNIIIPENFQASVSAEINSEFVLLKDK